MITKPLEVQASLLAADFLNLSKEIRRAEASGADLLHVDVMDGRLVDDISFGVKNVEDICAFTGMPVDVHLMIEAPQSFASRMADAGAKIVTIQFEPCKEIFRTITTIQEKGAEAAICIAPETSVSSLGSVIEWADRILLVSVSLGLGGQKFIPSILSKLADLIELRRKSNRKFKIGVDGGITLENSNQIKSLNIDYLVAGTAIFSAMDINGAVKRLKQNCP